MKKLSIIAIILMVAMLFVACSPSTPAPTKPQEGDTETIVSMIMAASSIDMSDAITFDGIPLNDDGSPNFGGLIGSLVTGQDINVTVKINKDYKAEDSAVLADLPVANVTSANFNISIGANANIRMTTAEDENAIEIAIPDGEGGTTSMYLAVNKAKLTLKSSGTNIVANITEGDDEVEHKVTLSVNTTKDIKAAIPDIVEMITPIMSGNVNPQAIIDMILGVFPADSFDLRLDGTRLDIATVASEVAEIFANGTN